MFEISIVLLGGFIIGKIFEKLKLPSLVGMLLFGIIIGPSVLNIIKNESLFNSIAPTLRNIALIVILLRAGLTIDLKDFKEIGRPAILMSFIPAIFEIVATTIFAPLITNISYLEAAILGTILAPVSAAVVIPSMINIIKQGYGDDKKIPQIILAGASIDDIFALILFTTLINVSLGMNPDYIMFLKIPLALVFYAILGFIVGLLINYLFNKVKIEMTFKILILVTISMLLMVFEDYFTFLPKASLLSIIIIGGILLLKNNEEAIKLEKSLNNIWKILQIILFVSIGIIVNLEYALSNNGLIALLIIAIGSIFRFIAVWISLIKTNLNMKERLFCGIGYLPKATVQAVMGAIPLSYGLKSGELILTVSVIAILVLAPIGSILINSTYKKILKNNKNNVFT